MAITQSHATFVGAASLALGLVVFTTGSVFAEDADAGNHLEVQVREVAAVLSTTGTYDDIEALAFLVMMEAAKSARDDLKNIMDEVKRINAAKGCLTTACLEKLTPPAVYDQATAESTRAQLLEELNSISEMGEMESLGLQTFLDQRAKTMSALSNIMKKSSDTTSTITQNMK